MKPLKGQMQSDGRIFDPQEGEFTYKIGKNGEVRDLQRGGGLGGLLDPKPGVHIGQIEKDGRVWNEEQGRYTHKIESDGRVWDLISGSDKPNWIERYRPPSVIERPVSVPSFGGGGGGAAIPSPFPEAEGSAVGFILGFVFIAMIIFGLCRGCEYTVLQVEKGIKKIYPAYETRQEQVEQGKREWQQVKDFFAGSERQLIVTENKPVLPQARLVFLAEDKDKKKRVFRINADGTGRTPVSNMSVDKYNDRYDRKWVPTGTSGNDYARVYHYRSSPVLSPNGEALAYIKGESTSYHWSTMEGSGQLVFTNPQTKTQKRTPIAYPKTTSTLTPQAWSPDGNKLALGVWGRGGYQVIQIIDLGRRGKPYILSAFGRNPSWSPDRNWIAFDHKGEIFVFEIGTVNPKTIKSRPYGDGFLTGGETTSIARGNIIRIGTGEKPFWEKGTYSSSKTTPSETKASSKPRIPKISIRSTKTKSSSALGIPLVEVCGQHGQPLALYHCTDDDYDPANWRISPDHRAVLRTFDNRKTWLKVWEGGDKYRICRIEARDTRSEVEWLGPDKRDIILIIDER